LLQSAAGCEDSATLALCLQRIFLDSFPILLPRTAMTDNATPPAVGHTEVSSMLESMAMAAPRYDQDVVEMPLLLPRWQADALEDAARSRGMTSGQMLRRIIAEFLPATVSESKR
jgi:hypothetical protein